MTPLRVSGEPILIDCEGSGCPANLVSHGEYRSGAEFAVGHCMMCHHPALLLDGDMMPWHQRDDIIARIKRGDFG